MTSRGNDQIESRSAFAAACRRSLTSASSRAARSMRSCCVCARFCWLSTRSCWLSARACWRSARSVIALRSFAISSTVRVSSASCSATLAMSSRVVTFCRSLLGAFGRSALGLDQAKWCLTAQAPLVVMEQWWFFWSIFVMRPHTSLNTPRMYAEKATSLRIQGARRKKSGLTGLLSVQKTPQARQTDA